MVLEARHVELIKLGKRGQVSIPKSVLRRLGLEAEVPVLVETAADGAILLKPAGVYPIEIYSDRRIEEFDAADRMDDAAKQRLTRALGAHG
ncbi:MAG: AbrB/MazE/SpoVT family DNA-binding domain-containing protein [Burkholderiales bacterium]|jgi:AbrB family looped-hinge helix DNA binding protein|nr:AbrB/MazE/SpoVT family DNA-binding domain-containing protein [Burkholderiales bacterium]